MSLTYLYCLVRSARRPSLRGAPEGVPGARQVRAIDAGDGLWLVVSDVPEQRYGEAAIARGLKDLDWVSRRAVGHEAVIEHFLDADAVLPMQLFTIFTSDARALAHVDQDRRRIDRILERVAGHHEWGLRLTWDEKAVRDEIEKAHRPPRGAPRAEGASYLARKRDLLAVNRTRLAEARTAATGLYRELSRHAADARRRTSTERAAPGDRLLLDAAYLVPATRAAAFRTALRRSARKLGSAGVVVSLTGPWPAYNFIAK